jgi:acyl-CoA synthetase (AMP-forming)/AMP-acid ligase II
VRRDADGFLYFSARRDRLIKTMGFRVGPDDVADVIHASGQVEDAVVLGEPDSERGERIVAYVVLRAGADLKQLSRYCRAELPPYMVPARFEPRDKLPRLVSGKYDVAALRSQGSGSTP